ncbi:MAG TPA: FAD-dependent oxidoreductase, partial [Flavipsychrobacter sp.]|nr:FAD-dependent oxidoreductase [Flavipsychrobacter sp.]
MNEEIIVVGAGACGLMAAYELCKEGYKITVLEAQNRLGGRIYTEYNTASSTHTELGAEFVHGDLPVTLNLLKQAGINYHKTKGEMWRVRYDELKQEDSFIEGWDVFEDKLKELKEDMTIDEFLSRYFSESKYDKLKKSVRGYAAGYDTADPATASVMALGKEWFGEEDMKSYRLENGYGEMIE